MIWYIIYFDKDMLFADITMYAMIWFWFHSIQGGLIWNYIMFIKRNQLCDDCLLTVLIITKISSQFWMATVREEGGDYSLSCCWIDCFLPSHKANNKVILFFFRLTVNSCCEIFTRVLLLWPSKLLLALSSNKAIPEVMISGRTVQLEMREKTHSLQQ